MKNSLSYSFGGTTCDLLMTDHQGSILALYKPDFTTTYTASYDAWGRQSVTSSVSGMRRGYCGHEHWGEFGVIDMNGRMYDPILGRFLSPDMFVQNPKNSQSFNRYSYCMNNPLKYVDPSGYVAQNTNIGRKTITNRLDMTSPGGGGGQNGPFCASSIAMLWGYNAAIHPLFLGLSLPAGYNQSGTKNSQSDYEKEREILSKIDPMNAATVFNTPNDIEAVINAIRGGNWTDPKELIDAIVASDYGAYGNVMLDNVYVYGKSTSAYRAATMDIWNQGNRRTRGGANIEEAGKYVAIAGAAVNLATVTEPLTCYRPNPPYGNRGKSVETITSEGKTGFNKFLTKGGKVLSFASLGIGAYDMYTDYQHYKLLDFSIGSAFLAASILGASPWVAGIALSYYVVDLGVTYFTDKSITQHLSNYFFE